MSNTKFNKLWDLLHRCGYVEFTNYGEECILSLSGNCYGADAVLEVRNGNMLNVVTVHWSKEHFRRILVDR